MTRIRVSVALSLVLVSALLLAACGGGDDDNEDPQRVLSETFSNPTPIKSGNFDVDFKIETNGGESPGTVEAFAVNLRFAPATSTSPSGRRVDRRHSRAAAASPPPAVGPS